MALEAPSAAATEVQARAARPAGAQPAPDAPDCTAEPAFEQTLQELEALVTQLESGDLELEEALRTFERGVRLTRSCQAALSAAQQKVQLLLQRGETVALEELDRSAVGSAAGGTSPSVAQDLP